MSTEYKPYDQNEIESLKRSLEAESREGKPLSFEIKIDGNTRIHKTNKVERFEEMHDFINENTKNLIIAVFPDENSKRKEWYKYNLDTSGEALNGSDVEKKVTQQVSEQMKQYTERMAAQRVEEKLEETKEKLEHAEAYIDILQSQLEDAKTKTNHIGNWDIGKLAGSTIKEIAIHYPKVLDNVPVLNGIARVIQEEERQRPKQISPSFEGDVSFKQKAPSAGKFQENNEHDQSIQRLSDFIGEHFTEEQKVMLGWVIQTLGENPSQLQTVAELLNIDIAAKMREEEQE